MRWNRYDVVVEKDKKTVYLFNTLTRHVVMIDKNLKKKIDDMDYESLSNQDKRIFEDLSERLFIVGDTFDEYKAFRYYIDKSKFRQSVIDATVLVTYNCNLECSYCYQEEVRGVTRVSISKERMETIIRWLVSFAKAKKLNRLHIALFGGEPLYNIDSLIDFLDWANTYALKEKVDLRYSMVTNGTSLSRNIVSELKSRKIGFVQVTLDGPKNIHDSRRKFRDGGGTFDIIIKNIEAAVDLVNVGININVDNQNVREIPLLLDTLSEKGLTNKVDISYSFVMESIKDQSHCKSHVFSDVELAKRYIELYEYGHKKGFNIQTLLFSGPCILYKDSSIIIDPEGNIYKCIAGVGKEVFKVCSVDDPLRKYYSQVSQFISLEPWNNAICQECKYLPLCLGGCRRQAYVASGRIDERFCRRITYEKGDICLIPIKYKESRSICQLSK